MRLLITALALCLMLRATLANNVDIWETWKGGYQAELCITSHADADCGWEAEVEFFPAIDKLEIWDARIKDKTQLGSSTKFTLIHKSYSKKLYPGKVFCEEIVTRKEGRALDEDEITVTAKFTEYCTESDSSRYEIEESWHGGFIGKLCVTPEVAVCGWQITMTFNPAIKKIKSLWDGTFVRMNGKTAVVDNASYNRDLAAGEEVCFGFDAAVKNNVKVKKSTLSIKGRFSHTGSCSETTPHPNTTPTPGQGRYNYGEVLHKSILFYEAQRSGDLPANNRIPWRGDSALGDSANGRVLTGGWYDAGDYVKFNFPMAFATSTLLWGLIRFEDGYRASGELENMYDSIRWPLDYFIKCWDSNNKVYWAQVGDGHEDHHYWGRPEEMTMARPAFSVSTSSGGSEVSAETAAALAAGSIAFKTKDPAYSAKLLGKAISLYDFAYNYRGTYTDSVPAIDFYRSYSGYKDELCWGAAWLYKATGNDAYIQKAHEFAFATQTELSWDDKIIGCQVLLYEIAKEKGDTNNKNKFKNYIESFLNKWMPGGKIAQTTCGLAWYSGWGSLRYAANAALIAMVAAEDGINPAAYRAWATKQINFMLGDNLNHRSYVVGFGTNPPVRPHHCSSSCPDTGECDWDDYSSPDPNPQILYGALVGGPAKDESYQDKRNDYKRNEVACDYNAGFQSTLAGLRHLEATSQLPSVSPPAGC